MRSAHYPRNMMIWTASIAAVLAIGGCQPDPGQPGPAGSQSLPTLPPTTPATLPSGQNTPSQPSTSAPGAGSPHPSSPTASKSGPATPLPTTPSSRTGDAASVAASVVDITTDLRSGLHSGGTGIVLSADGVVVVNTHTLEGASAVHAVVGGKTYSAQILGYSRVDDVAVIRLNGATGLRAAPVGDSGTVHVGDELVGTGNAGGQGSNHKSVRGPVTKLSQSVTFDQHGSQISVPGLAIVKVNFEPGMSGGPVADSGQLVVGMIEGTMNGGAIQSYVNPINRVVAVSQQIIGKHGSNQIHIGTMNS